MKRPSYRKAIEWILAYDDTEFLNDADPIISVTGSMVADLFGVDTDKVIADLLKLREKYQ